ncbi:helix-turn-helix transcriptional regulator [Paenibacillus sp. FSL R5-0636]|uniref:helix-turn-helix domain-containing protein n=1 Tax=Paenibacillus TaxID=44249 RepID=UPI0021166D22|nr:helix-turn-helix transcriptional regulator [Paenibacillus odorifer]
MILEKQNKIFKITLRAARINCGLTREEVAIRVNKSVDTIRKYESDSSDIPRDLLVALLTMYDVPDEHIFFGKESVKTGFSRVLYQKKTS